MAEVVGQAAHGTGGGCQGRVSGTVAELDVVALCHFTDGMKKTTIRLDDDLHDRVEQAAARDDRSFNGEVAWLLKAGMDASRPLIDLHYEYKSGSKDPR